VLNHFIFHQCIPFLELLEFGTNFTQNWDNSSSTSLSLCDFASQASKDRMMTPHQPEISKIMDKMFPGCLKLRPIRVSDFETFKTGWAKDDFAELQFQKTMT
jgi:hypothetical protein